MTSITKGLNFILGHLSEPLFPRRIFTPLVKQVRVENISDVYRYFQESEFKDSRVNAYPCLEDYQIMLYGSQAPDLLFVDLDRLQFKSTLALNKALHKTLKNIKEKFHCDAEPSILESGSGGFHLIQPLLASDLKLNACFNKYSADPNRDFLRFLEPFLSNNRADPNHYHHISMNNCLLRIPGSINSKSNTEVRILQRWNGIKPDIKFVYGDFLAYLIDKSNERRDRKGTMKGTWAEYCNRVKC